MLFCSVNTQIVLAKNKCWTLVIKKQNNKNKQKTKPNKPKQTRISKPAYLAASVKRKLFLQANVLQIVECTFKNKVHFIIMMTMMIIIYKL